MEIHEIKGNATLQVPVDTGQSHLVSNVGYSKVRKMGFCDGLVNGLVLFDTLDEVAFSHFFRQIFVIRVTRRYFQSDVCSYNGRIVADGLEEYHIDALFLRNPGFNFRSVMPLSSVDLGDIIMTLAADSAYCWSHLRSAQALVLELARWRYPTMYAHVSALL
jgi:hypothetical protein